MTHKDVNLSIEQIRKMAIIEALWKAATQTALAAGGLALTACSFAEADEPRNAITAPAYLSQASESTPVLVLEPQRDPTAVNVQRPVPERVTPDRLVASPDASRDGVPIEDPYAG